MNTHDRMKRPMSLALHFSLHHCVSWVQTSLPQVIIAEKRLGFQRCEDLGNRKTLLRKSKSSLQLIITPKITGYGEREKERMEGETKGG